MQFLSVLSLLTVGFSLASALPADSDASKTQKFHIVSKSISGPNPKYDGLYMNSFHSGAAMSYPAFAKSGPVFQLNGTQVGTFLGGQYEYILAFGEVEDLYAQWGAMTLNIGGSERKIDIEGFAINDNGYLINKSKHIEFTGWRICDWVHGVPELYFNIYPNNDASVPSNCELVHLVAKKV